MESQTPKLFIHGAPGLVEDGPAVGAQLQQLYPNLEVVSVGSEAEPVFHFIQEDAPEELGATLAEWIEDLPTE